MLSYLSRLDLGRDDHLAKDGDAAALPTIARPVSDGKAEVPVYALRAYRRVTARRGPPDRIATVAGQVATPFYNSFA
jgi:hypothetical protein